MSLYQQLLAAMAGAPSQQDRLLVLHTPLGKDVLLAERAEIAEAIGPESAGSGFRLVVHALAADTHIELKTLIGQPALLELLPSDSRFVLRPFHGHITDVSLEGSDGGLARYRLVIEPWLAFLAHRTDSFVFQKQTVVQIVESVFADYASQGMLAPAWRWELADASVYPERSLAIQYQESDLAFVQRLLREEGLFCWFEHAGSAADATNATLGSHTLVIADHNGAFTPSRQARVRYTQPGAVLLADSITRWSRRASVHTAGLELASRDYRSLSLRPQSQSADPLAGAAPCSELALSDVPGLYAYEDSAQGERLALRQMQALDALREQSVAHGTVRASAPGTTFTLLDHPVHDGRDELRDRFVILSVTHTARNNLRSDHATQVSNLLGAIASVNAKASAGHTGHHSFGESPKAALANTSDEPLYGCRIVAQRAAVAVRMAAFDEHGLPDVRIHARPSIQGVQTAIVVGTADPIHTDRDHRIKVQFHWQRGGNASHRLAHPAPDDNAPASEASGTWVRVGQSVAGANWGAVFTPRLGQEVLVRFVGGDIDRPVVVGAVYNGQGSEDAQGNGVAGGSATATGNASAWFPGQKKAGAKFGAKFGDLQGHQHGAVLAGYKSQELSTSTSGSGGFNQLVFDDSPGAGRIELASSSAQTRLQLGHLLHQSDNQRLNPRGHGLDLATAAWGALRAGSGLLLSAHGRPGSQSANRALDSREPQSQIEQSQQLLHTLAESAQQHKAKLTSPLAEPDVIGAKKANRAKQLPSEQAMYASLDSLGASDTRAAAAQEGEGSTGGGAGSITAWDRPDLVLAAPGGVSTFTPASSVMAAGGTFTLVAGQDLQQLAQGNHATAVKSGLVFYTYGKATNAQKPNTETGIAMHAASGNVNTQSQSAATKLTADKAVEVSSTSAMVKIAAPQHILLTAAGAAIDMQPSSITLKGPGMIEFKASAKEWTGPGSASASLQLPQLAKFDYTPHRTVPFSL